MRISEVSKMFDFSADTLRYYEKIGLIGPIKKEGNIRNYNEDDLNRINFVKCMRSANLPIEVLIKYMKLFEEGDATVKERRDLLVSQQKILANNIADLQVAYDRLSYKIDLYDKQLLEKNLKRGGRL